METQKVGGYRHARGTMPPGKGEVRDGKRTFGIRGVETHAEGEEKRLSKKKPQRGGLRAYQKTPDSGPHLGEKSLGGEGQGEERNWGRTRNKNRKFRGGKTQKSRNDITPQLACSLGVIGGDLPKSQKEEGKKNRGSRQAREGGEGDGGGEGMGG